MSSLADLSQTDFESFRPPEKISRDTSNSGYTDTDSRDILEHSNL